MSVCLAKSLLVQSDHIILHSSHANLLSRLMEGLQMGWSNHPMLVLQFPISTSSRLTDLAGTHAWMGANTPHPHPPGVQVLVEERMERSTADGDGRPVKKGPLKVMVCFEHY